MIDPSTCDYYFGTAVTDGKIVNPTDTDRYFSPKGLLIGPDLAYKITVTFEPNADAAGNSVDVWAYGFDGDPNSHWVTLYDDDFAAFGPNSRTFTIGMGHADYPLAVNATGYGYTRVIFDCYGGDVTSVTWTPVPKFSGALRGEPLPLDETEEGSNVTGGLWDPTHKQLEFNNYYSTSCRVWDDVVLSVWCHQGEWYAHQHGGAERAYECRAMRYVEGDNDTAPSLDLGPLTKGPSNAQLPGWADGYVGTLGIVHDPSNPASDEPGGNYRITQTWRLGDGYAYIQASELAWSQSVLGYVVHVDRQTLAVTFVRSVHPDSVNWSSDDWGIGCPGPGRFFTQQVLQYIQYPGSASGMYVGFYDADSRGYGGRDYVQISFGPDGSELARRYVYGEKPGTSPYYTDPSYLTFGWSDVMAIVDCGDYFVSMTSKDWTTGLMLQVWKHTVDGVFPSDNPTLLLQQQISGHDAWQFDATYMTAMPNGLIYILTGATWNISYPASLWVLDPVAGTLTLKRYLAAVMSGYSGHTWDWMGIEPIDANRAFFMYQGYWDNTGLTVGVFDGTVDALTDAVSDQSVIMPWLAKYSAYRNQDISMSDSASACYLTDGRVIGIGNYTDAGNKPVAATVADPSHYNQTWAVPARLWTRNAAINGDYLDSRRRFV